MDKRIKLLWLISIPVSEGGNGLLDDNLVQSGGWINSFFNRLVYEDRFDMVVLYPQNKRREIIKWNAGQTVYYGFYSPRKPRTCYSKTKRGEFETILQKERPELVHIWGTEYLHSAELADAFGTPEKTVISIQGLISICARHYQGDIPSIIPYTWTVKDLLRFDNLKCQQVNFGKRGKFEKRAIKNAGYLIGRTDWDEAASNMINPKACYFHVNEALRNVFYEYENHWSIERCKRNSIFISQAGYPLKGLHKVLEAAALIKYDYPDIKIYVAGPELKLKNDFKSLIRKDGYSAYIKRLIGRLGLWDNIVFSGVLSADAMVEKMLGCHVFVSASSIENESNALSEAKLLGMPVIASVAGGTACRVQHGIDGFQYQYEESYMLAYYLRKIFSDDELAATLGKKASQNASIVNDRENNYNQLLNTYEEILNAGRK
ncbi:MAG: glycosyltransferase [Lachnospiraceae bacterium]|nr:glycosyltransferase [Lachnospiraceae bacterium]